MRSRPNLGAVNRELSSRKTLPALIPALIAAANIVVGTVALGSFVFAGALAPYSTQGIRLILLGSCLICLLTALASGLRGAVAAPPAPVMVVMAGMGAALTLQGDSLFLTMAALTTLAALATGLCAALVGWFGLAHVVRFVPYPLACGFVSGTGAIAIVAALSQLGVTLEREALQALLDPMALPRWGLGVAYAIGLFVATRRWKSPLILPASFAGATLMFHAALVVFEVSTGEAQAAGLLFEGISEAQEGALLPLLDPGNLSLVDWSAVAGQLPNVLALILVGLLCLVIYLSRLELAGNLDLDWNREFRAMGLASLASGLASGPPGCIAVPITRRNLRLRADTRLAGIFTALLVGAALLFGDALLSLAPVPLIGGVLLFTGAILLDEWLIKVRRRLPRPEFGVVVLIFLTVTFFGFLIGVGVGMLVLVLFLIIRLAAVDPVKSQFTGRDRRSRKMRSTPDRGILRLRGEGLLGYELRGYIFFGSAHLLVQRLARPLGEDPPPICILLDFEDVTGCDISAANAFGRFILACDGSGTRIAMAGLPEQLASELRQNLPPDVHGRLLLAQDGDQALEYSEDRILEAHESEEAADRTAVDASLLEVVADDLEAHLDRQILFERLLDELDAWLETRDYGPGDTIVAAGEAPEGLLLVTSGHASVLDSSGVRLSQRGPGDAIEPRALAGRHTAPFDIKADEPSRIARLSAARSRWLEENEASLMLMLYRYIAWDGHASPAVGGLH